MFCYSDHYCGQRHGHTHPKESHEHGPREHSHGRRRETRIAQLQAKKRALEDDIGRIEVRIKEESGDKRIDNAVRSSIIPGNRSLTPREIYYV